MEFTKKQTTRMKKATCPVCGYLIRVSRKWLNVGCPTCACGVKMERDNAEKQATTGA